MRSIGLSPAEVGMLARLARDLPGFLRRPIDTEQALAIVGDRLRTRPERFLALVDRAIYGRPRNPFRRLLAMAGCEPGDLRALVHREGLEGALAELAERGIYLSFEEFKGHREIVRGSTRFRATETDFANPCVRPHFERRTGGTRGCGTVVRTSLQSIAELAPNLAAGLLAHGFDRADHAFWFTAPIMHLLRYAYVGRPPIAWFYPVAPLPWKVRALGAVLWAAGPALGCRLPAPRRCDLEDPARMAAWLAAHRAPDRGLCLTTYGSSAARVAAAAVERGLALDGVCFLPVGEPFTEIRRRTIEASGAHVFPYYGATETPALAVPCATPQAADDAHLSVNAYAVITRPRPLGDSGPEVEAFFITTLLAAAPFVLINTENGDHGLLERRPCGCLLGPLGLDVHLSQIRSHEKLTGEGMTFVRSRLLQVVEEVLPARFGGSGTDYQVVEQTRADGSTRLALLVSPALGDLDAAEIRRSFLDELGRGSELETFMAQVWERTGTVELRREPPIATRTGKILPFHVAGAVETPGRR